MPFAEHREGRASVAVRRGRAAQFFALMKPRVMSLAVFTALVGMAVAPGDPAPLRALVAIVAIAAGAGAAGALNMWYDADIDAVMTRTASRPVPSGRIAPAEALAFGLILTVVSVGALAAAANAPSAALLAATIAFYGVVYTMWLKYATPQNIVIGGAAGALPPVIGWTAVSGSLDWQPWSLFLIVFLWTPPHFWALALLKLRDYAAAGIPMLPNVAGETATRRQVFLYAALLAPAGVAPWPLGLAGPAYGVVAALLGLEMLRRAARLLRAPKDTGRAAARSLFLFSIVYLYALFATLLIDAAARRLAAVL